MCPVFANSHCYSICQIFKIERWVLTCNFNNEVAHLFALAKEGLAPFDVKQVIHWIGDGPDALIDRALASHGLPESDSTTLKRVRAAYDEQSLRDPLGRGKLFSGITDLLAALEAMLPPGARPRRARSVDIAAGIEQAS